MTIAPLRTSTIKPTRLNTSNASAFRKGLTLNEITELSRILKEALGWHQARIRFTAAFMLALLRVRSVNFPNLALALNPHAKQQSNERRLQRFFSSFKLDLDAFAKLLLELVPNHHKLVITLDRTPWQVGSVRLNILLFGCNAQGSPPPSPRIPAIEFKNEIGSGIISS